MSYAAPVFASHLSVLLDKTSMLSAPNSRSQHSYWLFTPVFLMTMLAVNLYLGVPGGKLSKSDLAELGVSLTSLAQGEWLRLFTGSFISHDADMLVRQLLLAAFAIGWFEWRYGPLRAAAMFFFLDVLGTLLLMFGVVMLIEFLEVNGLSGLPDTYDVGMSAGGFGLIGASLYHLNWRGWAMAAGLSALAVKALLFPEPIADLAHLMMLPTGFLVEALASRFIIRRSEETE